MYYKRQHGSLSDYSKALAQEAKDKALRLPDSEFEKDLEELATELSKGQLFEKTLVFTDKIVLTPLRRVETIPAHRREEFYRHQGDTNFECEYVHVSVPISSSETLSSYRHLMPSSYSLSWSPSDLIIEDDAIKFELPVKGYGFSHEPESVKRNLDSEKSHILQWISALNQDIEAHNANFRRGLLEYLQARKGEVAASNERMKGLMDQLQ